MFSYSREYCNVYTAPVDRPVHLRVATAANLLGALVARVRMAFALVEAERELSRLSDRDLADIGLVRSQIDSAARRFL